MMQLIVAVALAVLIFIGIKNKKKTDAEEAAKKAAKKAAEEKAAAEKAAAEKAAEEKTVAAIINDEVAKKYYIIVCGLLDSIKPDGMSDKGIKQYIKKHTDQSCDAEKFNLILTVLAQKNQKYFLNEKYCKLVGISVDDINQYKHSNEEAYNICYSEIIESIKTDCKEIFDVVASYGAGHFVEGLSKKAASYEKKIGSELTKGFFSQTIKDMYFEGNETVKTTLFNRIGQYSHDARMREYFRLGVENVEAATPMMAKHAAAITLRALHFEKHGRHQQEYKSITENDCSEFISNCEYIKREIDQAVAKDPFNVSEKKLIDDKVNEIFDIFKSIKCNEGWYLPDNSENYYADSLCNGFWKWVAEYYENGDSTDPNVVLAILMKFFTPSESDFEFLAKERRENDRKKAINKQCSSCALCGGFGRSGSCREYRENCPSWIPLS